MISAAAKIRLRINVPRRFRLAPDSEVRHNLFLAVKEILNNIAKHSRATEVFFNLKLYAQSASFEIRDNGLASIRRCP